jgi:ATP-dependent DNA helicase RecG
LRSLDIVHLQGRGRGTHYALNESLYDGATQEGGTSRKPVLDRETNKALLLKHIEDNRIAGSKMEELRQVLPAHSRSQIQVLLRELRSADRIHVHGATRAALWYPGPETEDCNHE